MTPEKIKQLRLDMGRSQDAAAKLLKVSRKTWSRWETGVSTPIPVMVEKLEGLWRLMYGE